jgi:exopolysaccharide biosynthesis predicted pyruvyltransferase EpsI
MTLEQLFTKHRDLKWYFLRPGGNWGDHLIYAGAERLANDIGLNWENVTLEELNEYDLDDKSCIYLHGSGGFNSWCSGQPFLDFKVAVGKNVFLVIQGPATVEDNLGNIKSSMSSLELRIRCKSIIFFAREKVSFDILKKTFKDIDEASVALDHDTALHLKLPDLLKLARLDAVPSEKYKLYVERKDQESASDSAPYIGFGSVYMDPAVDAKSLSEWIAIHLCAKIIVTNRLHSAIVGTIAGKKVDISKGNYHKNFSVWEYSLKNRGVRWVDKTSNFSMINMILPRRVRESYKVNQFFKHLHGVPGSNPE